MWGSSCSVLSLALLLSACAGNTVTSVESVASFPSTTVFTVYSPSGARTGDNLSVGRDTLTGIQLANRESGERVTFFVPVAEVDSILRVHPDRSGILAAALPFAVGVALMLVFRLGYGND